MTEGLVAILPSLAAIQALAGSIEPVAATDTQAYRTVFLEGRAVVFDRVSIPIPDEIDSNDFAYSFYSKDDGRADRYLYENGPARLRVNDLVGAGNIPIRLDMWAKEGRKSKPFKPVRIDVWFMDTVETNKRYGKSSARPLHSQRKMSAHGRYEGDSW